ncbi:MAG: PP2C family protein-serine/threonine phosphatase [Haloferula sp.]
MELIPYLLLLVVVIVFGLLFGRLRRRFHRKKDQLRDVETEEARMFRFLHRLGEAIGSDTSNESLYRIIVDGIDEVVSATGGAIYLLDDKKEFLVPKYLSADCPALIGVPQEIRRKAERDPRAMSSYLQLTQVPIEHGILGDALAKGTAVHITGLREHESFRDALHGFGADSDLEVQVAPLRHGGKDLGVLAVARHVGETAFTANDISVFRSAAEQSAFALGNALLYREAHEKRQIEGDLRNASEVQRVLLPQESPVIPGYRVHGTNIPARIISGDYYDHLELANGHHGVVIADVSGKGVAAGLLMAMCRSVLRAKAGDSNDPAEVLGKVNRLLFPDIREDMFVSLFYGVIVAETGTIRLARAGHDPALLYRAQSRSIEMLKPQGLALGVDEGDVFERITRTVEVELSAGDCLLFYTDGIQEATNGGGEEFGIERLKETFQENASLGAEASVAAVQRAVMRFAGDGRQMDDITMLALERR